MQHFAHYLAEQLGIREVGWEKGETPDRVMSLQDRQYAVEITTLIESIPLAADSKRPLSESHAIHARLVEGIEKTALCQGILDGACSVCFGVSVVGRPEFEPEVSRFVLDFLRKTSGIDRSEPETLPAPSSSRTLVWIVKHHKRYPRLCYAHPPIAAWGTEFDNEAQRIIEERVTEKIRKLANVELPKVLLFWDATSLIEPASLRAISVRKEWTDFIDAAFLVRYDGQVEELWSRILNW